MQLHFGPMFERPTLAGLVAAALRKTDSNTSLNASPSKHECRHSRKSTAEMQPVAALQAYQASVAPSSAAAGGSGVSLGLEDYVIHPHDRASKGLSSNAGARGRGSGARRGAVERLLGERGHKRSGSFGDSSDKGASFLDGSVITQPRNSRWDHSVADIKTMLAFNPSNPPPSQPQQAAGPRLPQSQHLRQQWQQRQQLLQQSLGASGRGGSPANAASFLLSPVGAGSFIGGSTQPGSHKGESSGPGSMTGASIRRSGSGGVDSDASGGGANTPSAGPDSPRSGHSPSLTPTRLLSPCVSRNTRALAQLPVLDTLHEEAHSRSQSVVEGASAGAGTSSPRRSTVSIVAAARALIAGSPSARSTSDSVPGSAGNSPRHAGFPGLSPRLDPDLLEPPDLRISRGSGATSLTPSAAVSPSPTNLFSQLLRSARASQQQDGSPRASSAASPGPAALTHPSPLQRQGSSSHMPPLPHQQPQLQEQPLRNSMARQVAALVSNRWLWRLMSRGEAQGESGASKGPVSHSCSGLLSHYAGDALAEGESSSNDGSPGAVATITTDADAAGPHDFAAALSAQRQGSGSGGTQQNFDSSGDGDAHPLKQHSARAFVLRLASSISRMSSRAATADAAPDAAAIRAAAAGLDFGEMKSAFSAASGNSRFDGLAASKKKLLASWASWR